MDRKIVVIAHNVRSTHNVGSLFRTCEGLGVNKLYLTGYTPFPVVENDARIPHLAQKIARQIDKTALGAQNTLAWGKSDDINTLIKNLKKQNFQIVALEQAAKSKDLRDYRPPDKIALIIGNELEGIDNSTLELADEIIEIPMLGKKESYNVVQATAMCLYHLRFYSKK